MSTPSNSNRLKGDRFRELVALLLRSDGLPVAKKSAQKLSVAILDDEAGDIQGLPGWLLNVRHEVQRDLSGNADFATSQAKSLGLTKTAVVYARHGRSAADSYTVMTLDTLSEILRAELGVTE
jgi:hypothetical protein